MFLPQRLLCNLFRPERVRAGLNFAMMEKTPFTNMAGLLTLATIPFLLPPGIAEAFSERSGRFMAGISWNQYTGGSESDAKQRSYLGVSAEAEVIALSQQNSTSLVSMLGYDLSSRKFVQILMGLGYGLYLGYPARKMRIDGQDLSMTYDVLLSHRLGLYAGFGRRILSTDTLGLEKNTETIEVGTNFTTFWNFRESFAVYTRPEFTYIKGIGAFRIRSYNISLAVGLDL
jgi:hypothetical protein